MNDFIELFPQLDFEDNELETFFKYIKLKGVYLHKQIYDIILLTDDRVRYNELSNIIRYDKYIRHVLYKYLSALEEQWRSIAFNNFEIESSKDAIIRDEIDLSKIIPKKNHKSSILYWASYNRKFTLSKLIDIFKKNINVINLNISEDVFQSIKTLRNSVMHHNLILFSYKSTLPEIINEITKLEQKISILWNLLNDGMKEAFEKAINTGNYKGGDYINQAPNLNRYCLRRFSNGLFI